MRHHWFLPSTPDVLATLNRQVDVTVEGMGHYVRWAHGDAAAADQLRAAEHAADEVRRELAQQLQVAFTTPVDQEDLFTLSERLDAVLNMAKNVARDADLMGQRPTPTTAAMADEAAAGVGHLQVALRALSHDSQAATDAADAATKSGRHMEKRYAGAMRELAHSEDFGTALREREHLQDCLRVGERIELVADRIWYTVVKEQ